jgi:hypothetical protein
MYVGRVVQLLQDKHGCQDDTVYGSRNRKHDQDDAGSISDEFLITHLEVGGNDGGDETALAEDEPRREGTAIQ